MKEILDTAGVFLPYLLGFWGLFLFFAIRRPQRLSNSVLLMGALFFSLVFAASLFGSYAADAMIVLALLVALAIFLVPVMLIINGIFMIRRESLCFANLLSLFLGVVIAAGEGAFLYILYADVYRLSLAGPARLICFLGFSVLYFCLWILAFVLYVLFIQIMPHRRNYDYIIIHGCGLLSDGSLSRILSNRVDRAIRLYKKCRKKPILIPSGGQGPDEVISEAEAMRRYLLEKGIPDEQIIPEGASATTRENLEFSRRIIEQRPGKKRVALVSSNYHIYRCILYAAKMNFRCTGVGAKVAWYYWPSATLREFAAVFSKKPHVIWLLAGYAVFVLLPSVWILLG